MEAVHQRRIADPPPLSVQVGERRVRQENHSMTSTPLITRIAERQGRIGPVCPVPLVERMSPFMKRLAERNLPAADRTLYNGAWTASDDRGAA